MRRFLCAALGLGWLALGAAAQPTINIDGEQMRVDLASSSVSGGPSEWDIFLRVQDDNANPGLPSSWRRWWHCEIADLDSAGTTLNFSVFNAGYADTILPVWSRSTDGVTFGPYERMPTSAVPSVSGPSSAATHTFSVDTPAGVVAIRVAKYFPYTVTDKDAFLVWAENSRHVGVTTIGTSVQGRNIDIIDLTDEGDPAPGRHRVWIHSAVHPAETTSYFVVEGLVEYLLSDAPEADALRRGCHFNIVPMANPDGVFLGNYRSNANSTNIEADWSAPYTSTVPETVALRTAIEQLMGTAASPGTHPIEVLLNLHSSHNVSFPFHFQHRPNFNIDGTGVIPAVNSLEGFWISVFRGRSAFTDLGSTSLSSLSGRPFVESMMHDRWSIDPAWTGPPNNLPLVMAITYEGTYGPNASFDWNTPDDYRENGREMALALFDYFGLVVADPMPAGVQVR